MNKVIVITGYVLLFINNLKSSVKKKDLCKEDILHLNEYNKTSKLWIKSEQGLLKRQGNYSKLNVSLKLFTDEEGIVRLKGRFANSLICYEERHPILLRSGSVGYFTTLIVRDSRQKVLYHGIETILNHIRSKFWITKGRKTVKDIFKECVTCKRYQGRTRHLPFPRIYPIIE